MPIHLNHTMGRVLARAWSDAAFKARLLAGPKAALAELDITVTDEPAIVARENTARRVHLVISAPPIVQPISAHSEIRDFAETYRDPRLWSLNWIGRDPPALARLVADPLGELGKLGVRPPKGLGVVVIANTAAVSHLILPRGPTSGTARPAYSSACPRATHRLPCASVACSGLVPTTG
jgi:nitrile hydratase subunit alpha